MAFLVRTGVVRLLLIVLPLTVAACAADQPSLSSCRSSADCAAGRVCRDGVCRAADDGGGGGGGDGGGGGFDASDPRLRDVVSIALDPPRADLLATDGSMPEQVFRVVGTLRDGSTIMMVTGASFAISTLELGDLDPASGRFVANGVTGGAATVTATVAAGVGPLTATAELTVTLERSIVVPDAPADSASRFGGAPVMDASRAATILYPLEGAVMPQNVYPADIQWLTGNAGDLFRITLQKTHARVTAYVSHSGGGFRNDWLVDSVAWRGMAVSDPDESMTITVDRIDSATSELITSPPVSMRFARAALTGSIYYWDIEAGRIVRIDDGTAARVSIMPTPPVAIDGTRCVGCHAVSPSGRYMVGRLGGGDNIAAVFDLTSDLTGDPPPTMYPISGSSTRWWFSSWAPDESRLIVEELSALRFVDPLSGSIVPEMGVALPTSGSTHPAWSPDGNSIAYAANTNDWGGAFTAADIGIIPVTGPDTVGATTIIQRGTALPGGSASAYPSWTPDSARIAFAHGNGCRSESHQSALYAMNADGSNVVRLDRGSGGPATTDSFQPRFSPFQQGGYFWLSFLSRRDYGNAQAGTRGSARQQIWVTAIRDTPAIGEDPSEVSYWLPGQNTSSRNISAYWAPRPCRPDGESCTVGSECCGGDCRPGPGGALVCAPPPPDRCRMETETCSTDADCCEGLACFGNVCVRPPG